jgi:spermidine/putrescine transport system substrate-binding protein
VRTALLATAAALLVPALAGCGIGRGTPQVAVAPASADAPVSGTLRVFAYEDTVAPATLKAFRQANPDVKLQIATFDSNQEAAAKLQAGFDADVVEVCLDEMRPLVRAGLLRPLQVRGLTHWNEIAPVFRTAAGVRDGTHVLVVPDSAGPQGLLYNTKAYPQGVRSFKDLFSPGLKGRVTLDGGNALTPLAEAAMVMGVRDPMNLTDDQVTAARKFLQSHRDQLRTYATSDSDLVNLYQSGEVVASDGGRGSEQDLRDEGVPVRWVAPAEGTLSWVCGLAISSKARNVDAAYKLINFYTSRASQAQQADAGFVIVNPSALPLVDPDDRDTADPAILDHAIPESQPANFRQWSRAWSRVKAG